MVHGGEGGRGDIIRDVFSSLFLRIIISLFNFQNSKSQMLTLSVWIRQVTRFIVLFSKNNSIILELKLFLQKWFTLIFYIFKSSFRVVRCGRHSFWTSRKGKSAFRKSFIKIYNLIRIIFVPQSFISVFDRVSAPIPHSSKISQGHTSMVSLGCLRLRRSKTPCPSVDHFSENPNDANDIAFIK